MQNKIESKPVSYQEEEMYIVCRVHPRLYVPRLSEHETWIIIFFYPKQLFDYFHWLLIFFEKLCCEYQTNVIFFSAMIFTSVLPKKYPLGGMEKGQKVILDYPNFWHIRTACL